MSVPCLVFDLKAIQAHLMVEGVAVGHLGDVGPFQGLSFAAGFTSKGAASINHRR